MTFWSILLKKSYFSPFLLWNLGTSQLTVGMEKVIFFKILLLKKLNRYLCVIYVIEKIRAFTIKWINQMIILINHTAYKQQLIKCWFRRLCPCRISFSLTVKLCLDFVTILCDRLPDSSCPPWFFCFPRWSSLTIWRDL